MKRCRGFSCLTSRSRTKRLRDKQIRMEEAHPAVQQGDSTGGEQSRHRAPVWRAALSMRVSMPSR
jgi:hypothetical protein